MKIQHLVALGLIALLLIWMLSPRDRASSDDLYAVATSSADIHALSADSNQTAEAGTFIVRVASIPAQTFTETVRLRGRTQAQRHVNVRAETAGRVVATPVPRGSRVEEGDVLCEIAIDNREADLLEARSRQEQARLEFEGGLDLEARGLQARAAMAQLRSALDSATAAVERAELALRRTRVTAPFSGIMESRAVEVGDYLDMGGQCASLLDDQPMLITGLVPEQEVGKLFVGAAAGGRLLSGETIQGAVTYISRAADPVTRSYRVEVELLRQENSVRQGLTAEIQIAASEIQAHLVPPSSLTLDDSGAVGVKTVDNNNVVHFMPVSIVGESTGIVNPGFWVTGLPAIATVITLGQEVVFAGQTVRTDFEWSQRTY